jgi:hypothetical protein
MNQPPAAQPDNRPLGVFLVLVGAAALIASRFQTGRSLVTAHDPGPWFVPLMLAVALVLGGAGIFWRSQPCRKIGPLAEPDSTGAFRWWFLGGLGAYLLTLPWLGFVAGTTLFITVLLRALRIVWWRASLAGLILALTAQGIFGWGFNVQLPAGFGR